MESLTTAASPDAPPHPARQTRLSRLALPTILLVALGLRLLVVQQAAARDPTFGVGLSTNDMFHFDAWAQAMARGDWTFDPRPEAPYSPTFSIILSAIYRLAGPEMRGVALVHVALSVVAVCAVHQLARLLFDDRVALLAATALALYVPDWFYDTRLLRATWIAACIAVGAWCLIAGLRESRTRWLVGAGLAFGLATAFRVSNLLPLLCGMGAAWASPRREAPQWRRAVGWMLAGAAVGWGPWLIWDAVRPRPQEPTSSAALINAVAGNTPDAAGVFYYIPPTAVRVLERAGGSTATAIAELGKAIAAEPVRWVGVELRKAVLFWHGYEPTNNVSLNISARYVPLLRSPVVRFWPTAVFALAGLMLTWRRSAETRTAALLVLAVYASIAPFLMLGRYRLAIAPLLMPFAAWTLLQGWTAVRSRTPVRRAATLAAFAVALAVLHPVTFHRWFPPGFVAYFECQDHMNLAGTLAHRGRLDEALAEYTALYDRAPGFAPAFPYYVYLLRATGRLAEAQAVCDDAHARGLLSPSALGMCPGVGESP